MMKTKFKSFSLELLIKFISFFRPLAKLYANKHINDEAYWLKFFLSVEYYKHRGTRFQFISSQLKYILYDYDPLKREIYDLYGRNIYKRLYISYVNERITYFKALRLDNLFSWFLFFYEQIDDDFLEQIITQIFDCTMLDDDYESALNQLLEKRLVNNKELLNRIRAKVLLFKLLE